MEDTFAVLYNRSGNLNSETHRTTILLLHEDYPHELPVFGLTQTSQKEHSRATDNIAASVNNSNKNVTGNISLNGNSHASNSSSESASSDHRIICILGAVRDASDLEIAAAITGRCRSVFVCAPIPVPFAVVSFLNYTAAFCKMIFCAYYFLPSRYTMHSSDCIFES